ncbi:acyl-CoA dehydrogenase family protein [Gordonia sp. CPCC 205333]|uniref:acyl-CoA dehydrogenase family protein n=1 Tax=Gordonia sp. CPCC 205333 TaxID=3140790 RepID=UPI003AF3E8AE
MKRTIYSDEHEAFRQTIAAFIAKEISPFYSDWEHDGRVPRELLKKMGELGVMGFDIPEEYGGAGETSYKFQAIMDEEAAKAAVAFGHYSVTTGIVVPYLLKLANDEQKKRWFPGIAAGDICLCIAMTEPGTGSDLAGIKTTAKLTEDGTHYVLNGSKTFITGALNSELCVVVARTSPPSETNRRLGLSLIVVPTDAPGFAYGRKLEKIGLKASDTNELSFTDVMVPVENLLGEQDKGFFYLGQNLPRERLSIGNAAAATSWAAIGFAKDYVQERLVFEKPVAAFQNTKFVLAECAAQADAIQALVDKGIELDDAGELSASDAARIKLFATETAGQIIDKCLQLHGGYGYMWEYPIARLYANTRVSRIFGGTTEVMKTIIAKELGL